MSLGRGGGEENERERGAVAGGKRERGGMDGRNPGRNGATEQNFQIFSVSFVRISDFISSNQARI